jgi:hypothetical protein
MVNPHVAALGGNRAQSVNCRSTVAADRKTPALPVTNKQSLPSISCIFNQDEHTSVLLRGNIFFVKIL